MSTKHAHIFAKIQLVIGHFVVVLFLIYFLIFDGKRWANPEKVDLDQQEGREVLICWLKYTTNFQMVRSSSRKKNLIVEPSEFQHYNIGKLK